MLAWDVCAAEISSRVVRERERDLQGYRETWGERGSERERERYRETYRVYKQRENGDNTYITILKDIQILI